MKVKHSTKKEGRGKEFKASSCNGKLKEQKSVESAESQDEHIDFGFVSLAGVDKEKLRCYSSLLKNPKIENLDHLQLELEMLLSTAVVRQRTLQAQIDALSLPQGDLVLDRSLMQKKRKMNDSRAAKSTKDLSRVNDSSMNISSPSSSENETDNSCDTLTDGPLPKSNARKLAPPKNHASNKFWAFVETYCSDITDDNIKELEQLIACCDNDMASVEIPPVGRHYTERWAEQELNLERSSNAGRTLSNSSDSDSVNLLKKASNMCHDRSPGPLAQRLVSALLEEPTRDSFPQKIGDDPSPSLLVGKVPLYHTTASFERRIRRELEAAGFLDADNNGEDEILGEIKKCEEELKIVASQNKAHITRLLEEAKLEMKRQAVKRKIREVNEKIISISRKAVSPKLKKKQLKDKRRQQAWKLIKERDALLTSLESIG